MVCVAGCSGPAARVCGEGLDPVVVTGLNGILDEVTPAVEVQLRVPETCDVLDTTWMFWDEATGAVRLGEAPTSGTLSRASVDVDVDLIFFRDRNLGVRLEYPSVELGPQVSMVWFTAAEDLARVDCAGQGEALTCAVGAP